MMGASGLSGAEQKAVDDAVGEKTAARKALMEHSLKLFQAAMDPDTSDQEIGKAYDEFVAAKAQMDRHFRKIDEALVKRVSLRTRAKLMTAGILESGLGFRPSGGLAAMPGVQARRGIQGMPGMQGMVGMQGRPGMQGMPGVPVLGAPIGGPPGSVSASSTPGPTLAHPAP
jgi:hypothetical protein